MPRPLRMEYENAYYHVMNRGRGRQQIFHGEPYYQAFLTTLFEAHQRFGLEIHAYCLMGNHYHLLLCTPRGNLSRCMRHINGLYTQRYNRLKKTDGPLFRGRYKAILVEADAYLLQLSRYIHRNPIDTKRPFVTQLTAYPWSSYPAYINQTRCPPWLERDLCYGMLGTPRRYQRYRQYVEAGVDKGIEAFYSQKHTKPLLGSEAFIEAQRGGVNMAQQQTLMKALERLPAIPAIVNAVAKEMDVTTSSIFHSERGRGSKNTARWLAICLSREVGGHALSDIAAAFHINHISGVNQVVRRLKAEMKTDRDVNRIFNILYQYLTP